jgi:hypothetical protein
MQYEIRMAHRKPNLIKGWSDPLWAQATPLEIAYFRPESSEHRPQTEATTIYDQEGLYGLYKVQDRYVRCVHQGYLAPVWRDS